MFIEEDVHAGAWRFFNNHSPIFESQFSMNRSEAPIAAFLLIAQGLDGIELGGLEGGDEAGQDADEGAEEKSH